MEESAGNCCSRFFVQINDAHYSYDTPHILYVLGFFSFPASFRLAAAREFELAGFHDWILLEASGRLGGRILTTFFDDGTPVEIGQRYVQGIQRNPLYDLAKEIDFRMHPVNWNKVTVWDENVEEVQKPPWSEWDKAFSCAEEIGKVLNEDKDDYEVIFGRDVLDQCGWEDEINSPVRDAVAWLDMEFEYGCSPDEASSSRKPKEVDIASPWILTNPSTSSFSTSLLGTPFPSLRILISDLMITTVQMRRALRSLLTICCKILMNQRSNWVTESRRLTQTVKAASTVMAASSLMSQQLKVALKR